MSDGVVMLLTIKSHETKLNDDGQARIEVRDMNGKKYTHWVNEEDGTWSKQLTNDGKQIYVYMMEKPNPKYPKFPFKNIYKPRDDVPPVPVTDNKGIPVSPPPVMPDTVPEPPAGFFDQPQPPEPAQNGHPPYISDKDTKIRWMNSITNATHVVAELIDIKKHGEPEIKNLLINYANFFNELESGMTMETLPISKAQVIELHNRLVHHGIAKLFYHEVLSKILGKQVIKTTDLTYQQAAQSIREFDETLETMMNADNFMDGIAKSETVDDESNGKLPF